MTSIRRYSAADLESFLRELDTELSARIDGQLELVIIGGAAAALAYRFEQATIDIDLCRQIEPAIAAAAAVVRQRTGLEIPIQYAAIFDAPWTYEDRLRDLELPGLTRLRLRVPAPEDLIVMKLLRGAEHDLAAAKAIVGTESIAIDTCWRGCARPTTRSVHPTFDASSSWQRSRVFSATTWQSRSPISSDSSARSERQSSGPLLARLSAVDWS